MNLRKLFVILFSIPLLINFYFGCKTKTVAHAPLQQCDTDIKSKCSGNCIDGYEPRYYFDSRNIQSVLDETDRRVAFLKKQGLGDLSDYPEILNNEKKNASFAKYIPPECDTCKAKFYLKGSEVSCEEFYKYIEALNNACDGCVEIVPEKFHKGK
ncbi:MAG TPA: hypothetical protein PLA51_02685 [Spirochaetota bacterium]|jgi:hypothetical protein|nr:hypothetical protein [Spirochaetota bacterium]HPD78106.1 hypothetical protein [Spirochaetota bacterium]HRS63319.1 hypothetical protein [Spirochaetota bacterium]HRU65748.1 hypothetical protein [Spirochaetota bacterium]